MILMDPKKAILRSISIKEASIHSLKSNIMFLESTIMLKSSLLQLSKLSMFRTGEMLELLKITKLSIKDLL